MGFFFGCFRFRFNAQQKNHHLMCTSIPDKKNVDRDELGTKKQLGSLFLKEGECDHASEKVANLFSHDGIFKEDSFRELKHEAEFLKSCGALLQTPAEIKKASTLETTKSPDVPSEYQVQLSEAPPSKKLFCDDEIEQLPKSLSSVHECSRILNGNTQSCRSKDHESQELQESAPLPVSFCEKVNFEAVEEELDDNLADAYRTTSPSRTKFHIVTTDSRQSPFPTPWKVTDEMQTPATVYPANTVNVKPAKSTRVRTQYINPVFNPVENASQWNLLKEGQSKLDSFEYKTSHVNENAKNTSFTLAPSDSTFSGFQRFEDSIDKSNNEVIDDKERLSQSTLSSLATPITSSVNKGDQQLAMGSLSDWLKPTPKRKVLIDDVGNGKNSRSGKSSDADRPIIGMVAAHWSDEKKLEQSPKIWDGNGIPNSTNKYKEDQKVSWHATPFEERLEKALSDESFLP